MKVRPLHDRILIKRIAEEAKQGGIVIPDTAKEKPQQGEVVAVGSGRRLENGTVLPLEVKAGDQILFGKYAGLEVKLEGNEFIILREDEILGIIGSVGQLASGTRLPGKSPSGDHPGKGKKK